MKRIPRSVPVFMKDDGCIQCFVPEKEGSEPSPFTLGECNVGPDANAIKGLPKNWERLLSWYPGLEADIEKARTVCRKMGRANGLRRMTERFSDASTVRSMLSAFANDTAKEDFLLLYIAHVMSEDAAEMPY